MNIQKPKCNHKNLKDIAGIFSLFLLAIFFINFVQASTLSNNLTHAWFVNYSLDNDTNGDQLNDSVIIGSLNLTTNGGKIQSVQCRAGTCYNNTDGINDWWAYNLTRANNLVYNQANRTFSCWAKPRIFTGATDYGPYGYTVWFSYGQWAASRKAMMMGLTTGDVPVIGTNNYDVTSLTAITVGPWYLFLEEYDNSTGNTSIWINNTRYATATNTLATAEGANGLRIGTGIDNSLFGFSGLFDDCYMWNRTLTSAEKTELYNNATYPFISAAPIANITSPTNQTHYAVNVNITFTANCFDDVNVTAAYYNITNPLGTIIYSLNNSNISTSINFTYPGTYNISLSCVDGDSQKVNGFVQYIIDNANPNVTISAPINNTHFPINYNITFTATCTDDINISTRIFNITNTSGAQFYSHNNSNIAESLNFTTVGLYNVSFFCNDTFNGSNSSKIWFTIDDYPSAITYYSPNGSSYNGLNLLINYSSSNSSTNITKYNISLCNANNSINTFLENNYLNLTYNLSTIGITDGVYKICINITNAANLSTFSYSLNFTLDKITPYITWYSPLDDNSTTITLGQTENINIGLYDANLYAYELAVYNNFGQLYYNNSQEGGLTAFYNVTHALIPNDTGTWTIYINASDSHTKRNIENYSIISRSNGITVNLDKIDNRNKKLSESKIKIDYISNRPIDSMYTQKNNDRYNFIIKTKTKPIANEQDTISFMVNCTDLKYLPDSNYSGHFVCWKDKKWIDFVNDNLISYKVTPCINNTQDCMIIDLLMVLNETMTFKSIGGLNYNTSVASFTVDPAPIPSNSSNSFSDFNINLSETSSILFLFLIAFLAFTLMIMGLVFRLALITFSGSIIGIILGFILIGSGFPFVIIIGIVIILLSIFMTMVAAKIS